MSSTAILQIRNYPAEKAKLTSPVSCGDKRGSTDGSKQLLKLPGPLMCSSKRQVSAVQQLRDGLYDIVTYSKQVNVAEIDAAKEA